MDRFLCSRLSIQHFSKKQHTIEYEEYAGNKFEFKTYKVQVAIFEDDFNEPPAIKSVRVRLSDEEYLLLLQWQLLNPKTSFNACDGDLCDIISSVECQVEEKIFGDSEIGTYAIYLSEIKQDVSLILEGMKTNK